MNIITPRGKLTTQLRALQDQMHRLRPSQSAGVQTTSTTLGVTRSAAPKREIASDETTVSVVPRWG
jgi:hypothetical protein